MINKPKDKREEFLIEVAGVIINRFNTICGLCRHLKYCSDKEMFMDKENCLLLLLENPEKL